MNGMVLSLSWLQGDKPKVWRFAIETAALCVTPAVFVVVNELCYGRVSAAATC